MSLFSPETWPFDLALLPADACLVGGSVRDRLLNRQATHLDLDFVLPERAVEIASAIAHRYQAGFVVLDAERQIARVVFPSMTVDFAQQEGKTLEDDLRRRDFTINAIAYNAHQQATVDPLNGTADIEARRIRMVSYQNLEDDPLRLLRAHRQAAQLGCEIAPDTQTAIAELSPLLKQVSIERVRSELDALLSCEAGTVQLKAIAQNQLLSYCLPLLSPHRVEQIAAIDRAISQFEAELPEFFETLLGWCKPVPPGCYRSWAKVAKLSRLISASVKQSTQLLTALTYSNQEVQVVLTLLKAQPEIEALQRGSLTRAQQFFLFKSVGKTFPAVALLARSQGVELGKLASLISRFQNPADEIAHAQPLVNGTILMKQIGLTPGPMLGKLLNAIEQAQATGEIQTTADAIAWAKLHNASSA